MPARHAARHAAPTGIASPADGPEKLSHPHRGRAASERVVIKPKASQAVRITRRSIIIDGRFLSAVRAIYVSGNLASACEGAEGRLINLVAAQLRRRGGIGTWVAVDIKTTLLYLAGTGEITLPTFQELRQPALVAS